MAENTKKERPIIREQRPEYIKFWEDRNPKSCIVSQSEWKILKKLLKEENEKRIK